MMAELIATILRVGAEQPAPHREVLSRLIATLSLEGYTTEKDIQRCVLSSYIVVLVH